ncbi:hypothetical protein [Paenibacillus sp. FSL R5-0701]|uniref:hypothetical protein n=1 Tax=Paenibacillus sp. FSL R5-0701 TaxID=2921654 RepID=UPI0030D33222
MSEGHRKAYEGKSHVWFDEEEQNIFTLYSNGGVEKKARYKTMSAAIRLNAAGSFSQTFRNWSGNHVKLMQSARMRNTGKEY